MSPSREALPYWGLEELLRKLLKDVLLEVGHELLAVERRSLVRHPDFQIAVRGRRTFLQPDGLFLFRQRKGGMMISTVEIDACSESPRQLATKFERYEAWSKSDRGRSYLCDYYRGHGSKNPKPAFRVLIVICGATEQAERSRIQNVLQVIRNHETVQSRVWTSRGTWLNEDNSSTGESASWLRLTDVPASADPSELPRRSLFPPVPSN